MTSSTSARDIAAHYNEIALAGHGRRRRSENDCVHLRRLNNWVKSVQILTLIKAGDCVFDLCSGKGGDLGKYAKRDIGYYVGCDVSFQSVKEAVQRYNGIAPAFGALLLTGDGFAVDLDTALPGDIRFDAVSCQFSLHYAFESEDRARRALSNVACRLAPGGSFFGTCPDANVIVSRMRARRAANPKARSFGNDFFRIAIDDPDVFDKGRVVKASPFGHRYLFDLNDAVNACPEWLVPKAVLVRIARDFGLELVYWMNLHQFFVRHASDRDRPGMFALLAQMKVGDKDGRVPLQEFEICGLYVAFAFRKVGDPDPESAPYRKPFRALETDDVVHV